MINFKPCSKRGKLYRPTQKTTPACRNSYGEREPKMALRRAGTGFARRAPSARKLF